MPYIADYDKFSGLAAPAGEALAECDIITVNGTGKMVKANANGVGLKRPQGVNQYACALGDNAIAWSDCVVKGYSGKTPGAPQYLGVAAGGITEIPIVVAGAPSVQIGTALAADTVRYRMDQYGRPSRRLLSFFQQEPLICKRLGAGAATGVAGDRNEWLVPGAGQEPGIAFETFVVGTQTIVAPGITGVGMDLGSQDQTAGDGIELLHGILARNPMAFVIGTDGAFYVKSTFTVEDGSGCNPLIIGFRKVEAGQAVRTTYTDYAAIGIVGTAAVATIKTVTQVGSGGEVATDTTNTWADLALHTLEVYVSAAGVVTYKIDGAAPTVVAAYTFTNALQVMPFVRFEQAADIAGKVEWSMYDAGQL